MDNCGKPAREFGAGGAQGLHACSACAGDYEDPDRTAPPGADEEDDESVGALRDAMGDHTGAAFRKEQ